MPSIVCLLPNAFTWLCTTDVAAVIPGAWRTFWTTAGWNGEKPSCEVTK